MSTRNRWEGFVRFLKVTFWPQAKLVPIDDYEILKGKCEFLEEQNRGLHERNQELREMLVK
jgi:hypothetical protein